MSVGETENRCHLCFRGFLLVMRQLGKAIHGLVAMRFRGPCYCVIVTAVIMVATLGCRSPRGDAMTARDAFACGDLVRARQELQLMIDAGGANRTPTRLDLAMVTLAAGEPEAAELQLRELRDELDAASSKQSLRDAGSLLADDRVRVFQAAPYEHVMIRTMLAVCSLSHDGEDAESYLAQAVMKQRQLGTLLAHQQRDLFPNPDPNDVGQPDQRIAELTVDSLVQPIAITPYLRGVIRESTHHNYDDAERNYRLASAIRPSFAPAIEDQYRASQGVHSQPGHGVLVVIGLVGPGPQLHAVEAPVTTAALTAATYLLDSYATDNESRPTLPSIKTVQVPNVRVPDSPIAALMVSHSKAAALANHAQVSFRGATQIITHVGEMMQQQLQATQPMRVARIVARRAVKESLVDLTRRELGLDGVTGSLFDWAASSAWVSLEEPDLRCWSMLPREFQVLRTELPAGDRVVSLTPLGCNGDALGPQQPVNVTIEDGRTTYLTVIAPNRTLHVVRSAAVGPTTTAGSIGPGGKSGLELARATDRIGSAMDEH
ncbi:MAG: hypothetical protein AAF539_02085 [Planctomycetota bacterium]